MTDQDKQIIQQAIAALHDAKRLWPAKHPATGMIIGIEEDCERTYARLSDAILNLTGLLQRDHKE